MDAWYSCALPLDVVVKNTFRGRASAQPWTASPLPCRARSLGPQAQAACGSPCVRRHCTASGTRTKPRALVASTPQRRRVAEGGSSRQGCLPSYPAQPGVCRGPVARKRHTLKPTVATGVSGVAEEPESSEEERDSIERSLAVAEEGAAGVEERERGLHQPPLQQPPLDLAIALGEQARKLVGLAAQSVEEAGGVQALLSSRCLRLLDKAKEARAAMRDSGGVAVLAKGAAVWAVVGAGEACVAWWKQSEAWLAWPVAVFSAFYLLVLLRFGAAVVADLTPLWIIGPLLLAYAIWQTQQVARVLPAVISTGSRVLLASRSSATAALVYLRSGELARDAKTLSGAARERVGEGQARLVGAVSERGSMLVVYVESGQLRMDAQARAQEWARRRAAEATEWATQRWEDTADWLVVARRRLAKILAKLF